MTFIGSIPTTRVSDMLVRERLLGQLQFEQYNLFKLQQQISSGNRFLLPSEDPNQALRGLALKDLLQRKEQSQVNLNTTNSYLSASESALASISSVLLEVRSSALSVVGNSASSTERQAVITSLGLAIDRLMQLSNQEFRGRHLFSGSLTSTMAFARSGDYISYQGNTNRLQSYSDLINLIDSNVTGDEAFGAVSKQVFGAADLQPVLDENTPLAQLRGGLGISPGAISVSDGLYTSVVNIRGAVTIGDVARLLEKYPPGWDHVPPVGRTLKARVGASGLEITLNGGHLSIGEVGQGTTAGELGLRSLGGVGPGPFQGADVNPLLTRTTLVSNLLGTRARAYLASTGSNNDLIVESSLNGVVFNDVAVKLVDDGKLQAGAGLSAGSEVAEYLTAPTAARAVLTLNGPSNDLMLTATTPGAAFNGVQVNIINGGDIGNTASANYDAGTKTLTLTIDDSGETEVGTLISAIDSTGVFTATRDTTGSDPVVDNAASIPISNLGTNVAGTYNTGSDAGTLLVRIQPGVTTAKQALAAINATGSFRTRLDFSETNNNGNGVVYDSVTDPSANAVTSSGSGDNFDTSAGIQIINGGQTYAISFSGATTVDDVLNRINGSGAGVTASINAAGTGIDVRSILSGAQLSIGENGGTTAAQLGIRSMTEETILAEMNLGAGVRTAAGTDFNITRRDGTQIGIDLNAGTHASATLDGPRPNDALVISRVTPGESGNAFRVEVTDSGAGGGNAVSLSGNTLTFHVDVAAGFSANDAVALLNNDPSLSTEFRARLDLGSEPANTGNGHLGVAGPIALSGGKASALTIGDVINQINNSPENLNGGGAVFARLATVGNGIELVDHSTGSGTLVVSGAPTATTAIDLGLIPAGSSTSNAPTVSGGNLVLTGSDRNPIEVRGMFTAVLLLKKGITDGDDALIERAIAMLDEVSTQVTATRADLGVRGQSVDLYLLQLQDERVELEAARSFAMEVDLPEAISQLLARQTSFQAALQAAGQTSKLSLLDFL